MLRGHKRSVAIEKFWRRILAQSETQFCISDIASREEYWSARRYVRSLVAAGFLVMVKNYNSKNYYSVVKRVNLLQM